MLSFETWRWPEICLRRVQPSHWWFAEGHPVIPNLSKLKGCTPIQGTRLGEMKRKSWRTFQSKLRWRGISGALGHLPLKFGARRAHLWTGPSDFPLVKIDEGFESALPIMKKRVQNGRACGPSGLQNILPTEGVNADTLQIPDERRVESAWNCLEKWEKAKWQTLHSGRKLRVKRKLPFSKFLIYNVNCIPNTDDKRWSMSKIVSTGKPERKFLITRPERIIQSGNFPPPSPKGFLGRKQWKIRGRN